MSILRLFLGHRGLRTPNRNRTHTGFATAERVVSEAVREPRAVAKAAVSSVIARLSLVEARNLQLSIAYASEYDRNRFEIELCVQLL